MQLGVPGMLQIESPEYASLSISSGYLPSSSLIVSRRSWGRTGLLSSFWAPASTAFGSDNIGSKAVRIMTGVLDNSSCR